jgi:Na+-transporting methylmalonyl-CoA/oxaloacetate decarboxylase gamma subunit
MPTDMKSTVSSASTKWMVLGMLVLVFLVMFHPEIGRLIDRVGDIEVSKEKVEIKTVQTVLGNTQLSSVVVAPPMPSRGIQGTTYVNPQEGFQISWPDNEHWTANEQIGKDFALRLGLPPTTDVPLVILEKNPTSRFHPNVNVMVEPWIGDGQSVRQTIEPYVNQIRQQGWPVLAFEVDEATHAALVVFLNGSYGGLYQIQRYVFAPSRAFTITASQLPPADQLGTKLREDLLSTLNSFRFLASA